MLIDWLAAGIDPVKAQCSVNRKSKSILVRTNRAVLEPKDVQEICQHISKLCKEEGCNEPSEMCNKAANAVSKADEEKYLELCAQSCVKCGEAKRPQPKKDAYVA